ncbi:MAG: coenzyme F420-0:L-glutamate ligase [Acidobacteria bacterium]|nr:coenzyme F420-0:L-glutamate ligase [Acidobacteriota bacterium]
MFVSHRARIEIIGLRTLPEVRRGDDLARLVIAACEQEGVKLQRGDVIVLAQKIVSKAEGRMLNLRTVAPSPLAQTWARELGADPRFIEVVLRESRRVVRMSERVLLAETRHGFVCANAGVDHSNVPKSGWVSCLPLDPDASAQRLVRAIRTRRKIGIAAIICDTFGRPWRMGLTNAAIGTAGLRVLDDWRGRRDAHGRVLRATVLAVADELAAAGGLAMGKNAQVPAVIIRGYRFRAGKDSAQKLIRPAAEDLFR